MLRNKAYTYFAQKNEKITRPKSTAELASLFVTEYSRTLTKVGFVKSGVKITPPSLKVGLL